MSLSSFFSTLGERVKQNYKAGIAVALINIPLSIPLAVASLGDKSDNAPMIGVVTAVWGGLIASLFASSPQNIYGPAGALSGILIVFSVANGPQYVPLVALIAGIVIMGVYALKLSRYITLIPGTVLHGFLLGVGITIASTQLNAALGYGKIPAHDNYIANITETFAHLSQTNLFAFGVFAVALAFLILFKKFVPKVPGVLPLTILGIGFGWLTMNGYVPRVFTLADKYPSLAFSLAFLPQLPLEAISRLGFGGFIMEHRALIQAIFQTGLVVAIVAILETLIAGKIAEKMTKTSFDKDIEVRGLGLSNIASGILGGMPSTAVLVRTALNAKSGANDRMSAFIAAAITLGIAALFFDTFKLLPVPVIAAILMNIALGMVEIKLYKRIWHYDRFGFFIAMLVAFVSVVEDPLAGIVLGTLLSFGLFVKKVSEGQVEVSVFRGGSALGKMPLTRYVQEQSADDVILYKFSGALNFINVSSQIEQIQNITKPRAVVFTFNHIASLDIDGIETLEESIEQLRTRGIEVYFTGLSGSIEASVARMHLYGELISGGKVFANSALALGKLGQSLPSTVTA